jgi:CspA family cold shock protein
MTDTARLTGCVKWFNNKTGYGFITVCGEERDIFVHYSNVKVEGLQYTYLVQGEYVEFDLVPTTGEDTKHSHQAVNITGIRGGPIMCQTRYVNRQVVPSSEESDDAVVRRPRPVSARPPRAPRASAEVEGDFTTVVRKKRAPVRKATGSA